VLGHPDRQLLRGVHARRGPLGYITIEGLYAAHGNGQTLLVSSNCQWFSQLDRQIGLSEVARFEGPSPVWSKTPSVRLFQTSGTQQ
jgi:hypothetical protein